MTNLYCIPKPNQLDKFVAFSKEYHAGFEYNDFFLPFVLDQPEIVEELINLYTSLDRDRSEDTLHGVFLDICVNSDDPMIFRASDYRIHQSMDIATKLGVKAVIFHTNHIPNFRLKSYRENWLSRNAGYWKALLEEYPRLQIYLENMFDDDPELLALLAKELKDEPRFGVCYDLAHAFISHTELSAWGDALLPYTKHLHINDNDKEEDTHCAVGSGSLSWDLYRSFIDRCPKDHRPTTLIEVRSFEDLMSSVTYMKEQKLYPFDTP